jgi:hypothetical protein
MPQVIANHHRRCRAGGITIIEPRDARVVINPGKRLSRQITKRNLLPSRLARRRRAVVHWQPPGSESPGEDNGRPGDASSPGGRQALHASGIGFVFNHFTSGPAVARDNRLHTAGWPQVERMLNRARPQARPSVRKIFFDTFDEALWWLLQHLGPEERGWQRPRPTRLFYCGPSRAASRRPTGCPRAGRR